jgi:hypothetical protein
MKTRFASDASTALNWASENDRVIIAKNLRGSAEYLAGEIARTTIPRDRVGMLKDLSRCYTRLAVCDMDEARKAERIAVEMQRDAVCRITLEKMADMVEEPCGDEMIARNHLVMAQMFARCVCDEKLDTLYTTGPYGGLGRLSATVAELDIDRAVREREALPALIQMARLIPVTQGVDEEKIESQIFRDGLKLFRKHQGLDQRSLSK